jgi:TatD DNase family protein
MAIIDTHMHLTDSRLWANREAELKEMQNQGIVHFLNAGFNLEDWKRQMELKKISKLPFTSSFGLHPYWVHNNCSTQKTLEQEWNYMCENISQCEAIGETGLDLRKQFKSSKDLQEVYFKRHIDLHLQTKKPLILHIVRSASPCLEILKSYNKKFLGIVHSFSGSFETAKEFIDLGFYISFSAGVCNPKSKNIQKAAGSIPLENLLIETDSPDQKPSEFASDLNHSWSITLVAEKIATLRGAEASASDIIELSNRNFKSIFKYQ